MADVTFATKGRLYSVNLGEEKSLVYPIRYVEFSPDAVVAYVVVIDGPDDPGRGWMFVSQFDGELRGYPMQRVTG